VMKVSKYLEKGFEIKISENIADVINDEGCIFNQDKKKTKNTSLN